MTSCAPWPPVWQRAWTGPSPPGQPVLVVLEQDMAKALGLLLAGQLAGRRQTVCIDGIHVDQGDYVDLGRPVMDGLVIPVVVKTLLFG